MISSVTQVLAKTLFTTYRIFEDVATNFSSKLFCLFEFNLRISLPTKDYLKIEEVVIIARYCS